MLSSAEAFESGLARYKTTEMQLLLKYTGLDTWLRVLNRKVTPKIILVLFGVITSQVSKRTKALS